MTTTVNYVKCEFDTNNYTTDNLDKLIDLYELKHKQHCVFEFIESLVKENSELVHYLMDVIMFIVYEYTCCIRLDENIKFDNPWKYAKLILNDMFNYYSIYDVKIEHHTGALKQFVSKTNDCEIDWFKSYKSIMENEDICFNRNTFLDSLQELTKELQKLNYSNSEVLVQVLITGLLKCRD